MWKEVVPFTTLPGKPLAMSNPPGKLDDGMEPAPAHQKVYICKLAVQGYILEEMGVYTELPAEICLWLPPSPAQQAGNVLLEGRGGALRKLKYAAIAALTSTMEPCFSQQAGL